MNFKKYFKRLLFVFAIFSSISTLPIIKAEDSDNFWFYSDGINEYTKTKYDWRGFDREGFHIKTGTKLDEDGYDYDGYRLGAIYEYSTVKACVGKDGFNHRGFNSHGIHKITGTRYVIVMGLVFTGLTNIPGQNTT